MKLSCIPGPQLPCVLNSSSPYLAPSPPWSRGPFSTEVYWKGSRMDPEDEIFQRRPGE